MALGQGRPEGGVAAGTEAAGIAEVLKSERAGRLLPFKEEGKIVLWSYISLETGQIL